MLSYSHLPINEYLVVLVHRFNFKTLTIRNIFDKRMYLTTDPEIMDFMYNSNVQSFNKEDPKFNLVLGDKSIFSVSGPEWKNHRQNYLPFFTMSRYRDKYFSIFEGNANKIVSLIESGLADGKTEFDVQDLFYKFTFSSFCEIGLNYKIDLFDKSDPLYSVNSELCECYDYIFFWFGKYWMYPKWWFQIMIKYTKEGQHFQYSKNLVFDWILDRIKFARKMQIEDAEGFKNRDDFLAQIIVKNNYKNVPYSDAELRDIIYGFIVAGRDTTAQGTAFTFKSLVENSDLEKIILAELLTIKEGAIEDLHDMEKTKFTTGFIYEALRLYPPVPVGGLTAATSLEVKGLKFNKGDYILRIRLADADNAELWENPKKFNPERFIHPSNEGIGRSCCMFPDNLKYTTFNSGKRSCMGREIAIIEIKVLLKALLPKFTFKYKQGYSPQLEYGIGMRIQDGLQLCVELRQ